MEYNIDQAIAILDRTPATLRSLLAGLDEKWTMTNRGGDSFSPFDVVGHLIHGERTDWIPRAQIILESGEDRPFEPFDRFAQFRESQGKSMVDLLNTFAELRAHNIEILRQLPLTESNLNMRGMHPEFGPTTMRQLLSTWVVHDLNHIMQIVRTLAAQYKDNVGPWRAYLAILK